MHTRWDASGTGMERCYVYLAAEHNARFKELYLTVQVDRHRGSAIQTATLVMLWLHMIWFLLLLERTKRLPVNSQMPVP